MSIYQKLSNIQNKIKAPKNKKNDFGKFDYRSAEDILEVAKPVCKEEGCVLFLSDDVVAMDGRFYIKATATLTDLESLESIQVTAFAREEENKKGMDSSQVTGACSSYSRKYAMGGLFGLDNTKDADSNEYNETVQKAQKEEAKAKMKAQADADLPISKSEEATLLRLIEAKPGEDALDVRIAKICKAYGVEELADMKKSQYTHLLARLNK